jgi:hypothetical protein
MNEMSRKRHQYISASVDIHDAEVEVDIAQLDDSDIRAVMEEAHERGIGGPLDYERDYAERALEALLGKRYGAAIALLDRALYPSQVTPERV